MGRYIEGDIYWTLKSQSQPSNTANRFGVNGSPNEIKYYFDKENVARIKEELKKIEHQFGNRLEKIRMAIKKNKGFINKEAIDEYEEGLGDFYIEHEKDYFDYFLGKKILYCIEKKGCCSFTAEL
jgi:hypothetical protein